MFGALFTHIHTYKDTHYTLTHTQPHTHTHAHIYNTKNVDHECIITVAARKRLPMNFIALDFYERCKAILIKTLEICIY